MADESYSDALGRKLVASPNMAAIDAGVAGDPLIGVHGYARRAKTIKTMNGTPHT